MTKRPAMAPALVGLLILLVANAGCQPPPAGQGPPAEGGFREAAPQAAPVTPPSGKPLFADDFSAAKLDIGKWAHTVANDFQTEVVDVVDGRLRMAAATIGTDDKTVKYHGVRTLTPLVDLTKGVEISYDLDWNKQANGCYMTAGIYLCPTSAQSPKEEKDWLSVEYWGVWPGQTARCIIATHTGGNLKFLLTEDWLQKGPGRAVTCPKVRLVLEGTRLKLTEDDKTVFETRDLRVDFKQAYLYLQHSSHSNYPRREVFFDNVVVRDLGPAQTQ
jgi:hypothetical protein